MNPLLFAVSQLTGDAVSLGLRLGGMAVLSGGVAAAAAFVHRAYTRGVLADGVALLVALSAVAVYLNAATALGQVVQGVTRPLAANVVAFNVAALVVGGVAAPVGKRLGDRLATDLFTVAGVTELQSEVSDFARTVGRARTLTLPDAADVDTVEGYDPVPEATVDRLGGRTFVFPRRSNAEALRTGLVTRLKDEHGVGYVDAEIDPAAGEVTYLALGDRRAGLGPTLAPGAAAVAVHADPPYGARPGDAVQLWASDSTGEPERLATGEVRAAAEDTVTLVVDAQDASSLAGRACRLVTLPTTARPERDFAALLRAADETMRAVRIESGSPLVDQPVGALDVTVVAVGSPDGGVVPTPSRRRSIAADETVYAVGTPSSLRRLETAAGQIADAPERG